ncbi:MAG: M48 family peptidase, partial [Halioglobus sp.]|nr:M48 family peptidase [Halioglobus sp.]
MHKTILLLLALSLLAACATSPTGRRQLMLISPDAAIVQSKQAYLSTVSDLDKENKLLDDPKIADRVATITG